MYAEVSAFSGMKDKVIQTGIKQSILVVSVTASLKGNWSVVPECKPTWKDFSLYKIT